MSQLDYIRDYYGIAIEKGMHVEDSKGRRGVIVGAGSHVNVQREGEKGFVPYHPEAPRYTALGYVGAEIREAEATRLVVQSPDAWEAIEAALREDDMDAGGYRG